MYAVITDTTVMRRATKRAALLAATPGALIIDITQPRKCLHNLNACNALEAIGAGPRCYPTCTGKYRTPLEWGTA